MEKTFVCVKPDGVQRGLIGEVVKRFESRGFVLCAAKFMQVTPELAAKHYAEHEGKPFYNGLISYITSGPVFAMVWSGDNVVKAVRQTVGSTNPTEAAPGTIRHDFAAKWIATSSTPPMQYPPQNGKLLFGSNRKKSSITKNAASTGSLVKIPDLNEKRNANFRISFQYFSFINRISHKNLNEK